MKKAIYGRQNTWQIRWGQLLHWLGWPIDSVIERRGELSRYDQSHLTRQEFRIAACAGYLIMFGASYLFYRSLVAAALLAVAGIAAPRYHRRSLLERRRLRLSLQFKEALYSIASSLAAGRSVENAFVTALTDLRLLYPNPQTDILVEFEIIEARMAYGESLEQALLDFSRRARIDDISEFADVFTTCKRSGGDLVEVIRRTSQTIGEKLDVQQEIAVMIAQKRLEARIMMAVPFVFLAFMSFAAPDYMAPLYGGIGYVLLTVSMLLLGLCYVLMNKIMNIRM
ncbi:type II secretion system protein F (GspF) [Paenibacillus taihuensis]|uniref:Type II secretion system protein F (GspF) n=1 Tax=Paenibacillus taihuensis TaxID=1156355 RepID=A0A3D9R0G7_9BACL|nr:type II secretion system F family protein [Paenibacillus taihuensis]REE67269.1 type II secretion system protein F (GspF) [Paenibacillus taihuensis]